MPSLPSPSTYLPCFPALPYIHLLYYPNMDCIYSPYLPCLVPCMPVILCGRLLCLPLVCLPTTLGPLPQTLCPCIAPCYMPAIVVHLPDSACAWVPTCLPLCLGFGFWFYCLTCACARTFLPMEHLAVFWDLCTACAWLVLPACNPTPPCIYTAPCALPAPGLVVHCSPCSLPHCMPPHLPLPPDFNIALPPAIWFGFVARSWFIAHLQFPIPPPSARARHFARAF